MIHYLPCVGGCGTILLRTQKPVRGGARCHPCKVKQGNEYYYAHSYPSKRLKGRAADPDKG